MASKGKMGRPTPDLTGERFGFLVAEKRDFSESGRDAMWICKCDCGNTISAPSFALRNGRKKSCGCMQYKLVSQSKIIDLTGQRFGRLVALERVGKNNHGVSLWKCKCDCGNECIVSQSGLHSWKTQSCGCLHKETFNGYKHGYSKTRIYKIWCAMRDRCAREKSSVYKYYGGKGIRVCDEWADSFMSFREWALANGYNDTLVIDRIDSTKNYCPSNCRWITQAENARLAVAERMKNRGNNKSIIR